MKGERKMGSTGAFLEKGGFNTQGWKQIGTSHGIKIIQKIKKNPKDKPSLPPLSNTPGTAYILYNEIGHFHNFRQFGENRKPIFDLEYGRHDGKLTLHLHEYQNGIRNSENPKIIVNEKGVVLNKEVYNKYKIFLKGLNI
jgi:hypothetical protein